MGWIAGKIHDAPKQSTGLRGVEVNADESVAFFKGLEGTPVFIEHEYGSGSIGYVMKVWQSARYGGQVLAALHIDEENARGREIFRGLTTLNNNGLSIGQLARIDPLTGVRYGPSTGVEISVVKVGAVSGSRVIAYGSSVQRSLSQSGLAEVLSHTQTMNEEVAAAMDTVERGPAYMALLKDAASWREHQAKWVAEQRVIGLQSIETLTELGFMTPELFAQVKEAHNESGVHLIPVIRAAAGIAANFSDLKMRYEATQKAKDEAERELAGFKEKEKKVRAQPEVSFTTAKDDAENPYIKRIRLGVAESAKKNDVADNDEEMIKAALDMFKGPAYV